MATTQPIQSDVTSPATQAPDVSVLADTLPTALPTTKKTCLLAKASDVVSAWGKHVSAKGDAKQASESASKVIYATVCGAAIRDFFPWNKGETPAGDNATATALNNALNMAKALNEEARKTWPDEAGKKEGTTKIHGTAKAFGVMVQRAVRIVTHLLTAGDETQGRDFVPSSLILGKGDASVVLFGFEGVKEVYLDPGLGARAFRALPKVEKTKGILSPEEAQRIDDIDAYLSSAMGRAVLLKHDAVIVEDLKDAMSEAQWSTFVAKATEYGEAKREAEFKRKLEESEKAERERVKAYLRGLRDKGELKAFMAELA